MRYSRYAIFLALAVCCIGAGCTNDTAQDARPIRLIFSIKASLPVRDSLYPVFPNPFSRVTGDTNLALAFTLKDSGTATLLIQNVIGDAIATYSDSLLGPGLYQGRWNPFASDGTALNPGLYFVTLRVRDYINSRLVNIQNND